MGGCVQFKKTGSFQLHFDCVLQPKNLPANWLAFHSSLKFWTKTQAWMLGSTSVARKHFSRTARTEAMTVEGPVERSAWVAFGVRRNPGVFDFNIHQKNSRFASSCMLSLSCHFAQLVPQNPLSKGRYHYSVASSVSASAREEIIT